MAPTAVVEVEEESSVEVLKASASVEKVGDQAVRIGDKPVHEIVKERTEAEPVLVDDEMETSAEPVPADMEMGIGDMPVRKKEGGDSPFEDFSGDDFEKVGEYTLEETSQSPSTPAPKNPAEETPASPNQGESGSKP